MFEWDWVFYSSEVVNSNLHGFDIPKSIFGLPQATPFSPTHIRSYLRQLTFYPSSPTCKLTRLSNCPTEKILLHENSNVQFQKKGRNTPSNAYLSKLQKGRKDTRQDRQSLLQNFIPK